MLLLAIATVATATTFAPPPPVSEQIAAASAVGEYVVVSTTTVTLDDGFVTTHAVVEPIGTPIRGSSSRLTVLLPGGMVNERWVEGVEDAPRVSVGEALFLVLATHGDLHVLANGWPSDLFRKQQTGTGAVMTDTAGRVIYEVSCDKVPTRAVALPESVESDEDDAGAKALHLVPNTVMVKDPLEAGMPWDSAVAAFASCGGAK